MTDQRGETDLHTDRAHSARIYDYILGGKDNYAADRAVAEAIVRANPTTPAGMRANRSFMHRVGRHLATEYGLRQFLDLGTGIPTRPNLHEVVQAVAPDARIVYVDNDPIVLAHARALMIGTPEGRTAYAEADLRDPARVLASPEIEEVLDLGSPLAVLLIGVIHVLRDDEAVRLLHAIHDAVPSGSYLGMTVLTGDFNPEAMAAVQQHYRNAGEVMELRTREQAEALFAGWDVIEPGLVQTQHWHPERQDLVTDTDVDALGAIARRP